MRYPLPMPFGWCQVAWPDEVPAGQAVPLYYFGRHLVAWRGEDGVAHLMDAFCPHLGSHLGAQAGWRMHLGVVAIGHHPTAYLGQRAALKAQR